MTHLKEHKIALRNVGQIDPGSIDQYIARGGYEGLKKALAMKPTDIIKEIEASGLRGRGGAGFPTGIKWKYTKPAHEGATYVICNADEGEPGTFKDRILMEEDPHSYLEGLIIAAYAIGASIGYVYIRGEYYPSIRRTRLALDEAKKRGFLGKKILGSDFSLEMHIKLGGGSYLCGEESALIESLEGKRGYPRIKPPYPAEKGVFNQPTLVNNVETLSIVPEIMRHGAQWLKSIGTIKSPGTKIFTISGDVNRPGCYEVPMGVSLKQLLVDLAGGMAGGKKLQTVLVGGAAGTFIPASKIDIAMDYDNLQEKGFLLGSGALIVLNDERSIKDMLQDLMYFFHHESCGKCVPCRVGTRQLFDMVKQGAPAGVSKEERLQKMLDLSVMMSKTSLCPLGQSPYFPIESALKHLKPQLLKTM
jgi:NADH:ubiquinone oxidoreductase subunit F (NADH-binding)